MNIYDENQGQIKEQFEGIYPQLIQIYQLEGEQGVLEAVIELAELGQEKINEKSKISCTKGCSFCCHDKIMTTRIEARAIKAYLKSNPVSFDKKLAKKQAKRGYDHLSWKDKKCVFVTPENTCGIYPVRPYICRTHINLGEVELCNREFNPNSSVPEAKAAEAEGANMAMVYLDNKISKNKEFQLHDLATLILEP
jgi:Fe-S-cluster containining protein